VSSSVQSETDEISKPAPRQKYVNTITDVLRRWQELTGMSEGETQARYRRLREAGFLPVAGSRVTDVHVASVIIGLMCGSARVDAPGEAIAAFDATPVVIDDASNFTAATFGIGLATIIRTIRKGGPIAVERLAIRTDGHGIGAIIVAKGDAGELTSAWHADLEVTGGRPVMPLERERSVPGELVHDLARLVAERGQSVQAPIRDRIADYLARREATEAAV
jgi:hypothetical protein